MGLVMNRAVNGGEDFDALLDEMFPEPVDDVDETEDGEDGGRWWDA